MFKFLFVLFFTAFCSVNTFAQNVKILDANDPKVCMKITGITQGFQEGVSQRFQISLRSISFVRPKIWHEPGSNCQVVVDTPNGLSDCNAGGVVISPKGEYLAHPYRKIGSNENYSYVGGYCRQSF